MRSNDAVEHLDSRDIIDLPMLLGIMDRGISDGLQFGPQFVSTGISGIRRTARFTAGPLSSPLRSLSGI